MPRMTMPRMFVRGVTVSPMTMSILPLFFLLSVHKLVL